MMNNYKSPLIKRLNSLFAARDVTPNRVAMLGGMRQSSLSDILIGRTKEPRLDTLQSIARGLGISLTELLDFSALQSATRWFFQKRRRIKVGKVR